MNGKLTYGASLIFGVLALILLIANVSLVNSNLHLQDSINLRQGEINKGTSLASLNQNLVQALAEVAVTNNDAEVKTLLTSQGITIKPNAGKTSAAASASPAKK